MIEMPSSTKGSTSWSAMPGQPTHAPSLARITGLSAVTSPPGECRQDVVPSAATTRSTGRRLGTTTRSYAPGSTSAPSCAAAVVGSVAEGVDEGGGVTVPVSVAQSSVVPARWIEATSLTPA